jgi:hypothetical protein
MEFAEKNELCREIGIKVWSDVNIVPLGTTFDETLNFAPESMRRLAFTQEYFWMEAHSVQFHRYHPN